MQQNVAQRQQVPPAGSVDRQRGAWLEALQTGLADWELCYNTIRPHQALGYLTPAEYLASLDVEV